MSDDHTKQYDPAHVIGAAIVFGGVLLLIAWLYFDAIRSWYFCMEWQLGVEDMSITSAREWCQRATGRPLGF